MNNGLSGGVSLEGPLVLVTKVKGATCLAAIDPIAARLGLRTGMSLADARVLVPQLRTGNHDPRADDALMERLADACVHYTPNVARQDSDALLLDLTGCLHLHGGESQLIADIEARMARRSLRVRAAFAHGPEAALALARFAHRHDADEQAAILSLPVAALRLGEESETVLRRAGLQTIGDVARRPLSMIAARFGEDAVRAIRRMTGDADSAIGFRVPRTPFSFERRFAEPMARTDHALAILHDLLVEAAAALAEQHRGGRRFKALFFRADGMIQRLVVETASPSRDVAAIDRLFGERIDTLADPLDPGFGYDMIRLVVAVHEPLAVSQLRLEGGEARATRQVEELIDRLTTRLGRHRVLRFVAYDSHIPELAQQAIAAIDAEPAPSRWPASPPGNPPMRPLHLFDPPQRIEVLAEVPEGPPHRFRWRSTFHEITRAEGPERIASEWWRAKSGDPGHAAPTRDYYRVEDQRGRRFWLFRHGLYSQSRPPVWYIHGLFA